MMVSRLVMYRMRALSVGCALLAVFAQGTAGHGQTSAVQDGVPAAPEPLTLLRATVRRVVVDVVVTDAKGHPVEGLTKSDFILEEDGRRQTALSFEANGFGMGMDYLPPKLPAVPANTFFNLPRTPEKGPLYVLLYDLVNMDNEDQMAKTVNQHADQMWGRQQLVKFIQGKPEGSRFAIFVWSDGLHLVQGFTADKEQLYAAIDPHGSRPHVPKVFLMGQNMGRGDTGAATDVLRRIAGFLEGMPGRKNLIWFSGGFPLALFPGQEDGPKWVEQVKTTLNLLTQNQVAIYPVDVRGVVSDDYHATAGPPDDKAPVSQSGKGSSSARAASSGNAQPQGDAHGTPQGVSLLRSSYFAEDEIARQTGGRAFYSTNDVADALVEATRNGSAYYTLTYAPTNHDYDGGLRHISVKLEQKGYTLAYRRSYYGLETPAEPGPRAKLQAVGEAGAMAAPEGGTRRVGDSLSAIMQHGAPAAHQLVFGVGVHEAGAPAPGTPAQMAALSTQPAYFRSRKKGAQAKPLAPVPLQAYRVEFSIFAKQFPDVGTGFHVELAMAAYDADARMLNAAVRVGTRQTMPDASGTSEAARVFRVEDEFDVPLAAAYLRFAVRDMDSDRVGAVEVKLPLAPEAQAAAAR